MRALVLRAFETALAAVDARRATAEALRARPIAGPVHVLALGKAAIEMTAGACGACAVARALVIAPHGPAEPTWPAGVTVLRGRHPIPDADVARRGDALLAAAAAIPDDATALVLVSGGGSALVDAPVDGVDAAALGSLTERLLASGAAIDELNAIRVALSRSKGGGLARAIRTPHVRVLVVSDIVAPSGAERVASGPMTAWRGADPREVAARPHVAAALGGLAAIVARWRPDAAKSVPIETVADNAAAVAAAAQALREAGRSVEVGPPLAGEARACGHAWAEAATTTGANALVAGGETVVVVRGTGVGGRSQEVALAALEAGIPGTFLCAGTDGIDGPTRAAGGVIDDDVRARLGVDEARRALDDNDSGTALARVGAALVTGPTGTNVADLAIWVRGE